MTGNVLAARIKSACAYVYVCVNDFVDAMHEIQSRESDGELSSIESNLIGGNSFPWSENCRAKIASKPPLSRLTK